MNSLPIETSSFNWACHSRNRELSSAPLPQLFFSWGTCSSQRLYCKTKAGTGRAIKCCRSHGRLLLLWPRLNSPCRQCRCVPYPPQVPSYSSTSQVDNATRRIKRFLPRIGPEVNWNDKAKKMTLNIYSNNSKMNEKVKHEVPSPT